MAGSKSRRSASGAQTHSRSRLQESARDRYPIELIHALARVPIVACAQVNLDLAYRTPESARANHRAAD